jgi:hypothetical protein
MQRNNLWKGVFTGHTLSKHVEEIAFRGVLTLSLDDWKHLDYPNLNPAARARIDAAILNDEFEGFYDVRINRHLEKHSHGGKDRYLYPGKKSDDFDPEDVEFPQPEPDDVDRMERGVSLAPPPTPPRIPSSLFWTGVVSATAKTAYDRSKAAYEQGETEDLAKPNILADPPDEPEDLLYLAPLLAWWVNAKAAAEDIVQIANDLDINYAGLTYEELREEILSYGE